MNDKIDKLPWMKNAFVLCGIGVGLALSVLVADVYMTLKGFENGLSEGVTTPLMSFASGIVGYAGAVINIHKGDSK